MMNRFGTRQRSVPAARGSDRGAPVSRVGSAVGESAVDWAKDSLASTEMTPNTDPGLPGDPGGSPEETADEAA